MPAKILIVEDESTIASDLTELLTEMGYAVTGTAFSGEQAIEKAANQKPDLVLMDIRLRGDMDGVEGLSILY